jgi:F-type H+-transporting ATPase subunit b
VKRRALQLLLCAGLFAVCLTPAYGQENSSQRQEEPENTLGPWRIANTLLFAAVLGYFLYRSAPKFFNARTADIQKAIKDATGLKIEADFRYSEVDRKIATLGEEIKRLREESAQELEREHQRMQRETEGEAARLRQNLANEIEAFQKQGVRQIRQATTQAAVARAEQRLRERLGNAEPDQLVQDFVQVVEKGRK